jgi:hypothetical protein
MNGKKSTLTYPLVFLALAIVYSLPFFLRLTNWGIRDWDLFETIAAVPAGTILHYHQFPFWNPYLAGGNILFHHPEVAVLSPFLLLYLVFGAIIGLKLQVFICYFLGFWGSHKLFTKLGMTPFAALIGSVAYFGSVHFALHFAEGHMPFTHFCFLPWFIYFVLRSVERFRFALAAGMILALMILGNGAAVPLLYTLTFSGLLFLLLAIDERRPMYLAGLATATLSGILLSAVKFLPMVVYLLRNRWEGNPDESIPLSALGKIFFGFKHSLFVKNFPAQFWNWQEYGAYISPLLVLLAIAALIFAFKKTRVWIVLAAFFLVLGLGNFGEFSLWAMLSHLPGFSSARCTGRSFQFVILPFAVLGGLGYDLVLKKYGSGRNKWLTRLMPLVAVVIMGTNIVFAWPIMSSAFDRPPQEVYRSPQFTQVIDKTAHAYENYLANRGSLISPWLSAYHPSRGLVDAANNVVPEYALTGSVQVVSRNYTPNRIMYDLDATTGGEMVIGMGYDRGWKATDGRNLFEKNGVIGFPYRAGRSKVELVYRTPHFIVGLLISLVSLLALPIGWRRL